MVFGALKRIKEFWGWLGFAWQVAGFLGLSGLAISIGGSVWAMILGWPGPFILMAAFCTFACAVWLALAPIAYATLAPRTSSPTVKGKPPPKPNYTAIRLQHQYDLGAASRLWVGLPPNPNFSNLESESWYQTFISAIQQGNLKFIPRRPSYQNEEKRDPDYRTLVSRDEGKIYAASIGQDPEFLCDK
jgi:hypothetical protein